MLQQGVKGLLQASRHHHHLAATYMGSATTKINMPLFIWMQKNLPGIQMPHATPPAC
jgi:hypothetical protein